MKIAIAANGDKVAAHAGHCQNFMIYEIDAQVARLVETRPNPHADAPFVPHGERSCGCHGEHEAVAPQARAHGHGERCQSQGNHEHGHHGQGKCCGGHGHGHEEAPEAEAVPAQLHDCEGGLMRSLKDCHGVVMQGAGWGMIEKLRDQGLRVILSPSGSGVADAASAFAQGALLDAPARRPHGGCCHRA